MLGQLGSIKLVSVFNKELQIVSHHITSRWVLKPEQHIPGDAISCSHVDSVSPIPDCEYANIARVTVAQQPSLPAADLRLWNITNGSWRRITARNLVLIVMF